MRTVLALVACLALGVAGTAAGLGIDASQKRPALRLVDRQPLILKGVRFKARERVRVVVEAADGEMVRVVRARVTGSFVASFGDVVFDRCTGLRVVATGARGSRASLKLPKPACPPPP